MYYSRWTRKSSRHCADGGERGGAMGRSSREFHDPCSISRVSDGRIEVNSRIRNRRGSRGENEYARGWSTAAREQFRIVKQIARLLTSRPFPSLADCYCFSMIAAVHRHSPSTDRGMPHRFRSLLLSFLFSPAYFTCGLPRQLPPSPFPKILPESNSRLLIVTRMKRRFFLKNI